jgi:S-adenosylmethionine/arginine decarboxylase-like enzyme
VFTCGADCPPEAALAVLRAALSPGRECVRVVPRGDQVSEIELAP